LGSVLARTGTTWLHRMLEGHVDLPQGDKKTQFFTTFYSKGIDWYAHHFRYVNGSAGLRRSVRTLPGPERQSAFGAVCLTVDSS
jgi:hypothetical protein